MADNEVPSANEENMEINWQVGDTSTACVSTQLQFDHDDDGDDATSCPKPGMTFKTAEEVKKFYKQYGKRLGFGTRIRNSKKGPNGQVRYMVICCSKEGEYKSSIPREMKTCPTKRVHCSAKINISFIDNVWMITAVNDVHNHVMSPGKGRLLRGNKNISMHVQRRLQMNDDAGVRLNKSFRSLVRDAGGHDNLPFVERDIRSYVYKQRKTLGKGGDGKALLTYFARMREHNSEFFYDIDLDDDFRVKHVFWADARSRAAYESFSDVVSFDTTYLTNKYDMPFAPFVGVNHHRQSILLGCGLLSSEDTTSFVWLFKTWLRCMSFVSPKAIITDQCTAMKNVIEIVFPTIRHRWCLWYIMKKLPEKLKGFKEYDKIKHLMKNVVYESHTMEDFDLKWKCFIDKFDLINNDWLSGLFVHRHRWVSCYLRDQFWAGMSTTQRSESMNAFFDGYIHSSTTLEQFVRQYENALQDKIEKEYEADFHSMNTMIPCGSQSTVERQFQLAYTHAKFQELQAEFRLKMNCCFVCSESKGSITCYKILEERLLNDDPKDIYQFVTYDKDNGDFTCTCKLFEFKGIICKHSLVVLAQERVKQVGDKYILQRWCKNVKRRHSYIKTFMNGHNLQPRNERFDHLCKRFYEIAEIASESTDKTEYVNETLNMLQKHVEQVDQCSRTGKSTITIGDPTKTPQIDRQIHSPVQVSRKGRPRTKRRQSTVEKVCKRKRYAPTLDKCTTKTTEQLEKTLEELLIEDGYMNKQFVNEIHASIESKEPSSVFSNAGNATKSQNDMHINCWPSQHSSAGDSHFMSLLTSFQDNLNNTFQPSSEYTMGGDFSIN